MEIKQIDRGTIVFYFGLLVVMGFIAFLVINSYNQVSAMKNELDVYKDYYNGFINTTESEYYEKFRTDFYVEIERCKEELNQSYIYVSKFGNDSLLIECNK
jgi:hypothetical protein